jgi:hypothetical protein
MRFGIADSQVDALFRIISPLPPKKVDRFEALEMESRLEVQIPLRIAHFFQGTLHKEEAASAFLAMAIEGVPMFRRHFFEIILPDEFELFH